MTAATTATSSSGSAGRLADITDIVLRTYGSTDVHTLALVWAARGERNVSLIDCDVLSEYLWWHGAVVMRTDSHPSVITGNITLTLADTKREECKSKETG